MAAHIFRDLLIADERKNLELKIIEKDQQKLQNQLGTEVPVPHNQVVAERPAVPPEAVVQQQAEVQPTPFTDQPQLRRVQERDTQQIVDPLILVNREKPANVEPMHKQVEADALAPAEAEVVVVAEEEARVALQNNRMRGRR